MADQKIKTDLKIYIIQEVMTDKKKRRSKHREKYIFNLSNAPPP